jgi:molecular chaperone GrpE
MSKNGPNVQAPDEAPDTADVAEENAPEAPTNGDADAPAAESTADENTAPDVGADAEALAAEAEHLEQELAQTKDRLLRQMAEFQNFRRRMERERDQQFQFGQTKVLRPLLDVLDDFRRSLEAAEQVEANQEGEAGPAYQALKEGVEMVYQKFNDELEKLGVEPIEAVGQPFDETLHDAMMQQPAPDDDTPEGTVLDELQRGYRLGDRVLRHAKVIVAG